MSGSAAPSEQLKRTSVAAALFVIALVLFVASRYVPKVPENLNEFFLALTAAMAVHLLDRLWLFKDTQQSLDGLRQQIVDHVAKDTKKLTDELGEHTRKALDGIRTAIEQSIKSLEAMNRSGILRLYATREDAGGDISQDLTNEDNNRIRVLGISLDDFVLRKDPTLGHAWHLIQNQIEKGIGEKRSLDIKVLLIDPTCLGAQLRSKGEERLSSQQAGRLKHDVDVAIDELLRLHAKCRQDNVKFECRLYRLPPILFLCLTDSASYVQQYHFWSSRLDNKSFPVLRFQNIQSAGGLQSLHAELEQHFNWIWENASVALEAYCKQWSLGPDKGVSQAGILNVFTDPVDGLTRMQRLLEGAQNRVCLQGISLHSFFNRSNPRLYQLISALLMKDQVEVEVLLLNPASEQALFRAYRESSFDNQAVTRAEYFDDQTGAHRTSALYLETMASKAAIEFLVREISLKKPDSWRPKLKAGFYDSSPFFFMIRIDDSVLVEQYHYGKLPDDLYGARVILGKDLPLIEYTRTPSDLFDQTRRTPFALLESHFDFALRDAALFPVADWATTSRGGRQPARLPAT